MSHSQEDREIREVRFVSACSVFWGVVLLAVGVSALLPYHLSQYVWPAVAIAGGVWFLFGPAYWYWEQPRSPYREPADRI